MSLGIFSFDLAAIINSLSNFMATGEPETAPATIEIALDKTEDVLQNASVVESVIDDVLMAAALNNAVTAVISAAETVKKESSNEKINTSKPAARTPSVTLDEETRKEIERLIKSLQTSVIHNYQSTDIIGETVSFRTVANFPQRNLREDSDDTEESIRRQKKRDEQKSERLRDELKKAILRSNSDV